MQVINVIIMESIFLCVEFFQKCRLESHSELMLYKVLLVYLNNQ